MACIVDIKGTKVLSIGPPSARPERLSNERMKITQSMKSAVHNHIFKTILIKIQIELKDLNNITRYFVQHVPGPWKTCKHVVSQLGKSQIEPTAQLLQ